MENCVQKIEIFYLEIFLLIQLIFTKMIHLRLCIGDDFSKSAVTFFDLFIFLGPHAQYMELPRLGVQSEL